MCLYQQCNKKPGHFYVVLLLLLHFIVVHINMFLIVFSTCFTAMHKIIFHPNAHDGIIHFIVLDDGPYQGKIMVLFPTEPCLSNIILVAKQKDNNHHNKYNVTLQLCLQESLAKNIQ